MLSLAGIFVGLVLLLYGRRVYWVFVAGIGFLTGFAVAPRLVPGQPEWKVLLTAFILALVGAVLAVMAQKVIIALIGGLAGGGIGVLLLQALRLEGDALTWVVYLAAGVVGLVLLLALFEWGLILLSSLAGANMIVGGVERIVDLPQGIPLVLVLVVAVIGIVVQARVLARRPAPGPRA